MDFQCLLSRDFHCLLKASLPRWPHEGTTISVWKRSRIVDIHFEEEEEKREEDEGGEDGGEMNE